MPKRQTKKQSTKQSATGKNRKTTRQGTSAVACGLDRVVCGGVLSVTVRFLTFKDRGKLAQCSALWWGNMMDYFQTKVWYHWPCNRPMWARRASGWWPGSYVQTRSKTRGLSQPPLTHVELLMCFNRPLLAGQLPPTVRWLHLGDEFNQPLLPGTLPDGLTSLILGRNFSFPIAPWPGSLTTLVLSEHFNQPLGKLPPQLRYLETGFWFKQALEPLPPKLRHLKLGFGYSLPLPSGTLPASLQTLVCHNFDHPLVAHKLPAGLTRLHFESRFNQPLQYGVLPAGLTSLHLGPDFDQPLEDDVGRCVLPASLTQLTVGPALSHRLPLEKLPRLRTLQLAPDFALALPDEWTRSADCVDHEYWGRFVFWCRPYVKWTRFSRE